MTKIIPATLIMLSVFLVAPAHAAAKRQRVHNHYDAGLHQPFADVYEAYGPPAYCYASPEPAFCPAPRPISGYVVH